MYHTVRNNFPALHLSMFLVMAVLVISPPLYAGHPPAHIFGNYVGAGQCPADSAKTCTDTGVTDNIFIQQAKAKVETEEDILIRELDGTKIVDAHVAIRILRDYGHSCALEGDMYWSDDHLEFQDKPPYGIKICKLQLWVKDSVMTIKDPGNVCGWKFCPLDKPTKLANRHFKKSPDSLLTSYKQSTTPPPATIFGTYHGTGECATDERKTSLCNKNKLSDYIIIKPGDAADAHIVIESSYCRLDADAMWLDNHLSFIKSIPDNLRKLQLLQFWFDGNTVVLRDVWGNNCGVSIQGSYFKKTPSQPSRDTQH